MRNMFKLLFVLALTLPAPLWAAPEIDGQYDSIGTVPARHSLQRVTFEEFLNFTCPHCNNFRGEAKGLFKKYGNRINRIYVPILFRGQADHPLRLFYIAEAEGKQEQVKDAIFDAAFKFNANVYDKAVVAFLARQEGLYERYKAESQADWVSRKVFEAQQRARAAGVDATPTIVLQNALRAKPDSGMAAFVNNLDALIGQLLKP